MARATLYAGTSGWSYAHWAKGRFYPKGLKQGDWLAFYAERFPTVEVNMTFYRLPTPALVTRWRDVVGPGFRFAIKLWRRITHDARLRDVAEPLAQFLRATAPLGEKLGPLLVQLPPSLQKDTPLLDAFLAELKRTAKLQAPRVAVEFRHPSWLCDATSEVLTRYGAAVVLADMPRCPATAPNEAKFVYIRRHGPSGGYRGCYAPVHISKDARDIRRWLDDARDVYIYYNNDVQGHAVDNARQLRDAVGE
ncbi:MAG: DUF72 domain-containing protein [Candidatus Hydrogenedentes bacterium]|nr:DUF72 domain-containing protein [Candidatus Hydrogenedentota bacterium]